MKVIVCSSCALGADGFAGPLENALADAGVQADVASVVCMSGCARPSTVAFRAAGKTAYLFGDLTAGDLPELVQFARRYAQSADGEFADARPLGQLRFKALARIPGDLSESGGMCRKSP